MNKLLVLVSNGKQKKIPLL